MLKYSELRDREYDVSIVMVRLRLVPSTILLSEVCSELQKILLLNMPLYASVWK